MSYRTGASQSIEIIGQHFIPHPERVLFWEEKGWLLIADLHLGKAQHFRRHGIPVSNGVLSSNLQRCADVIAHFNPLRVVTLGDLFHSSYNRAWEMFADFVKQHQGVAFHLIPGNHDILPPERYADAGMHVDPHIVEEGPFLLAHQYIDDLPPDKYGIYGHVHPGVKLTGQGQQAVRLPCFMFCRNHALLPAFGAFTGMHMVRAEEGDRVLAIAEGQITEVPVSRKSVLPPE